MWAQRYFSPQTRSWVKFEIFTEWNGDFRDRGGGSEKMVGEDTIATITLTLPGHEIALLHPSSLETGGDHTVGKGF